MCGYKYRCLWRKKKDVICPRTGVIDYYVPPSVDACILFKINKQIIEMKKNIGSCDLSSKVMYYVSSCNYSY